MTPLLSIEDLRIATRAGRRLVDVAALEVAAGETVGIVGESGSGKSLTARCAMRLLPPNLAAQGTVRFGGQDLLAASERQLREIRGCRIALLPQDPYSMLSSLRRAAAHVDDSLKLAGDRSREQRRAEVARRLAEVGIEDERVGRRYGFELSGGMRQRVGLAAALARDPELLIADEPSTALDVRNQRQILDLLKQTQERRGMGMILITHDLRVAFESCDRIYVLYAGLLLEQGPAASLAAAPRHPYTLGLLLSEPPVDRRVAELEGIPGSVPQHEQVGAACAFAPRCTWRQDACTVARPSLVSLEEGHASACVRVGEIDHELDARRVALRVEAPARPPASAEDALLSIRGLSKSYDSTAAALAGVDLDLRPGEAVGVVGESGSGKTTLARCVMGLELATAGTIVLDGIEVQRPQELSGEQRRRYRRAVQMVFQDPYASLNPTRTVAATLTEALSVAGRPADEVPRLLELVGLPAGHRERRPIALSGGERQRVALARAIAVRPRLIVCDEPVSALDVSVQAQILRLLAQIRSELGIAMLFITHDLAVVRQVADRLYVFHHGQVVEHGDVDDVLDRPAHPYTQSLLAALPASPPALQP